METNLKHKKSLPIKKKDLIKTERLELKPYSENDIDTLIGMLTNSEITKFFMVPEFKTNDEVKAVARKLIEFSQIADTKHLEYGIYLDGNNIGFVNDCGIDGDEIEIGYVISPNYKGNGYATEAVKVVLKELKEMGFHRVVAGFFEDNQASYRVMTKCGFHLTEESEYEEYRGKKMKCYNCEILL